MRAAALQLFVKQVVAQKLPRDKDEGTIKTLKDDRKGSERMEEEMGWVLIVLVAAAELGEAT